MRLNIYIIRALHHKPSTGTAFVDDGPPGRCAGGFSDSPPFERRDMPEDDKVEGNGGSSAPGPDKLDGPAEDPLPPTIPAPIGAIFPLSGMGKPSILGSPLPSRGDDGRALDDVFIPGLPLGRGLCVISGGGDIGIPGCPRPSPRPDCEPRVGERIEPANEDGWGLPGGGLPYGGEPKGLWKDGVDDGWGIRELDGRWLPDPEPPGGIPDGEGA